MLLINFLILFIILILIIIYYSFIKEDEIIGNTIYVKSELDNKEYLVRDLPDKQEAANMLARLKLNIDKLVEHLYENKEIAEFSEYKEFIEQLKRNIKNTIIYETKLKAEYTSYSVNKGEELVFCVRSKEIPERLHKLNLVMYVCLHELAHVANPEYGHGEQFQKIFVFFTKEAIKIGIYKKEEFFQNPQEYCGININESIV